MKIVITGSLGHISRPLTEALVEHGHSVVVISTKPDKQKEIETLGAVAAIGSVEDVQFLIKTFIGADLVYCMIPPNYLGEADPIAYYRRLATNYKDAVLESGVKRVIHLSTYGADLDKGTGMILGSHNAEQILNDLPKQITLTHMRPTYFYYNLYLFIKMIKEIGKIRANYGAEKLVMVAPLDIAIAIAQEIDTPSPKNNIRYVSSDEVSGNEIAEIIGKAIGKANLKWEVIGDKEMQQIYESHGLTKHISSALVEMFESLREGRMAADYYRNEPAVKGKTKFTDFAKEFAAVYANS